MLRDRHKNYVEYLVTGGKGRNSASPGDLLEVENICQQVNDAQSMSTAIIRTQIVRY